MNKNEVRPKPKQDTTRVGEQTAELERRAKAEGLDLDAENGKERFEELLSRASRPKK